MSNQHNWLWFIMCLIMILLFNMVVIKGILIWIKLKEEHIVVKLRNINNFK